MTGFIKVRDQIRNFIISREMLMMRLWNFAIVLAGALLINREFGYMTMLRHWWIAAIIAAGCAFIPLKGSSAVLLIFTLVHFSALSPNVAITTFIIVVILLAICGYFQGKNIYMLMTTPVCMELGIPFAIPLGAGYLRNMNDLSTVLCGGFFAYYLKALRDNAGMFLDSSLDMTAGKLIKEKILTDPLLYFYLVAIAAMFLLVNILRTRDISYAWLKAAATGILAEFIIMVTGYLFTGNENKIVGLFVSNLVVVVIGLIFTYFIADLDYSRIERTQFEDDDYYYFVTAVPKVKITEDEVEVKKITEETQTHSNMRRGRRHKERK